VFNEDGTEVYFRKWAVPHDVMGTMRVENGVWTAPRLFKPHGRYVVSVPMFYPGADHAFFITRAPLPGAKEVPGDYNVWTAPRTPEGWGPLTPLGPEVNNPEQQYLQSVSARGTLFFQASREDSEGGHDLYFQELIDGEYQPLQSMGEAINTENVECAPAVSADESFVVFCAVDGPGNFGSTDLYVSFKGADGTWGAGINLGPGVNDAVEQKFPALSPDGKYIFFVGHQGAERGYIYSDMTYAETMARNKGPMNGEGDVFWVSAEVVEQLRPR
jgi:hypothetical protein